MPITIESGQDYISMSSPEVTSDEAKQYLPVAEANYAERKKDNDNAKNATAKCQAICDADGETLRFFRDAQVKLTQKRDETVTTSRAEFHATREACNIKDISSLIAQENVAVAYVDAEYDHLLTVQAPADHILLLDALANQASAEHNEACAAAALSRVRTLAALGPVVALEGGTVGIVGAVTESLRENARILAKKAEVAQGTARDARIRFERQRAAYISKGIITSLNMPNAMGR